MLAEGAAWAFACGRLEAGLREAAGSAQGWAVSAETLHWGGWPLAAEVRLGGVVARSVPPGLAWRAARVRVRLGLLHPMRLSILVEGEQSVEAAGLPTVKFTARRLIVTARLDQSAPPHVRIATLQAGLPAGPLGLREAEVDLPDGGVAATLTGLVLPEVAMPIDEVRLRASVTPAIAPAATTRASAAAWRAADGRIEVSDARLNWGPLAASGQGTITLDAALQPAARGTVEASGLPALLDALVPVGTLTAAQAGAAKAVVALLSAPSGGARVELPLSVDDGVLRIARFPLLRLPPLAY